MSFKTSLIHAFTLRLRRIEDIIHKCVENFQGAGRFMPAIRYVFVLSEAYRLHQIILFLKKNYTWGAKANVTVSSTYFVILEIQKEH